jgi:hypothetical protein
MSARELDQERARAFIDARAWCAFIDAATWDELWPAEVHALAEQFSAVRLDERASVVAWLRRPTNLARSLADAIERGEHGS